jgi:hypothetical protein
MIDQSEVENATKAPETTPEPAPTPSEAVNESRPILENEGQQIAEKKKKNKKKKKAPKPQLHIEAPEFQPTQVFQFDPSLSPIKLLPIQPSTSKTELQIPKQMSVEEKKETD